jgi:hemerythrin-like metal-binding protein
MMSQNMFGRIPSVGNALLDEQHLQAFEMLQAAKRVLGDSAPSLSHFHGYLEYFLSFLELHFATEEEILARNACPSLAVHKMEHDSMLEALRELRLAAIDGTVNNGRLLEFMNDLIGRHVPEVDLPLKHYMR